MRVTVALRWKLHSTASGRVFTHPAAAHRNMARRQQLRAGAAERGIAKLPDLLSRRQTWGAYRHHWEYSGGNLRQIKLIAPRLDYGTAMPAIRICIAVS